MKNIKINFIKHSRFFLVLSLLLTSLGLGIILTKGFKFGIDFSGGNEIQIQFEQMPEIGQIRSFLEEQGMGGASVQSFGDENEVLIRMEQVSQDELAKLSSSLQKKWNIEIRRIDSVGPQIGNELKRNGILSICYALLMILIYLGLRFDYNYAPAAVFCLFHDSILTMTVFSLLSREVNIQTLAAILAIIGYSLNDTIVTFDRIRENVTLYSKKENFSQICNRSLNDVLSRTLLTSFTTLMAVSSMWFFAQGVIKDFAFTLGIGVVIGTFSSIYVATPLTLFLQQMKQKRKANQSQ